MSTTNDRLSMDLGSDVVTAGYKPL